MFPLLLQTSSGSDLSWQEATAAVAFFTFIMAIVIVLIWQGLATWRARMSIAREDAYRRLAEENLNAQTRLSVQQQRIADDLTSINERVAGIEKLLKDVG